MKVAVCHSRQKIIQTKARGQRWLRNKFTVLGPQTQFSTNTKLNLLRQTTQDPYAKAGDFPSC